MRHVVPLFKLGLYSIIGIFLVSCKHKTEFDKMTEISYSINVAPIISSNCAFSGCHGDSLTKEVNLLTYDGMISAGIEPGKPESSKLYKTLVDLNENEVMPKKPYNVLSDKQIQLIYVWIGQGAKNN